MKNAYESLTDIAAWELDDYANGKPMPLIATFFDQHPAALAQWSKEEQGLAQLKTHLFRFECPPAEQLQDYHWDDLQGEEKHGLEQHLQLCPVCTQELETLRNFVPTGNPLHQTQPSLADALALHITNAVDQLQAKLEQVRLVVANLMTPTHPQFAPQFATVGLRGDSADTTTRANSKQTTQIYEFEEVTISLTIRQQDSAHKTLWGQLLTPDSTTKRNLTLIAADASQPERTTRLNESGNFEFSNMAAGEYQLQIFMDEQTIVIPNLHLL